MLFLKERADHGGSLGIWGRKDLGLLRRGRGVGWGSSQHHGEGTGRGELSFTATPTSAPQRRRPIEGRGLAFSPTHSHTHTHPTRPQGPHHPSTLTGDVELERFSPRVAPWSVTRQVRLVPWSWGLGVRLAAGVENCLGSWHRGVPQENRR